MAVGSAEGPVAPGVNPRDAESGRIAVFQEGIVVPAAVGRGVIGVGPGALGLLAGVELGEGPIDGVVLAGPVFVKADEVFDSAAISPLGGGDIAGDDGRV